MLSRSSNTITNAGDALLSVVDSLGKFQQQDEPARLGDRSMTAELLFSCVSRFPVCLSVSLLLFFHPQCVCVCVCARACSYLQTHLTTLRPFVRLIGSQWLSLYSAEQDPRVYLASQWGSRWKEQFRSRLAEMAPLGGLCFPF